MRAAALRSFDRSIALLAGPKDAKEGLKAFGERRKASWPWK